MLTEYEYFVQKTRQVINEINDLDELDDDEGVQIDDEKK